MCQTQVSQGSLIKTFHSCSSEIHHLHRVLLPHSSRRGFLIPHLPWQPVTIFTPHTLQDQWSLTPQRHCQNPNAKAFWRKLLWTGKDLLCPAATPPSAVSLSGWPWATVCFKPDSQVEITGNNPSHQHYSPRLSSCCHSLSPNLLSPSGNICWV